MSQAETKPRTIGQQQTIMNLNKTHPGRPGPEELVPSRYALQIGEIEVLVISDGVVTPPTKLLAPTPTRPPGGPGWTTCTCRGTRSIGR